MDMDMLKNFLLIAQEENLTRASEKLHISQPTLSRQIQSLEEEVGKKLFDRKNKIMSLNANGRIFWARAREILDIYQRTLDDIDPQPGVVSGDICMAVSESSALRRVLQLAKEFQDEYPMTAFRVLNGDNNTVKDRLETGEADIGMLFNNVGENQFDSFMIKTDEFIDVLMPADHPLASKEALEVKDLEGYPLIIHDDSLRRRPKSYWKGFRATFTMLYTAELMVEAGLGIALVNDSILNFESNGLVAKKLKDFNSLTVSIAWKRGGMLSQQAELFLDKLRKEMIS